MFGRLFHLREPHKHVDLKDESNGTMYGFVNSEKFRFEFDVTPDGIVRVALREAHPTNHGELIRGLSIDSTGAVYNYFGAQSPDKEFKKQNLLLDSLHSKNKEVENGE